MRERPGNAEGGPSSLAALNDWGRIEPLIDAVLDAPPDRRDEVARELSGGDDAAYARLQGLAADCAKNHRLLDRPAAERFASLFDPDPAPVPETHLIQRHYDGFLRKGRIRGGRFDRASYARGEAARSTTLMWLYVGIAIIVIGGVAFFLYGH